jgi:cytochrome c oxidase subunit II
MALEVESVERRFVGATIGVLVLGILAIAYSVIELGVHLPTQDDRVDPNAVARGEVAPFDQPGVTDLGDGRYRAVVVARAFSFDTGETMVVQDAATGRDVEVGVLRIPRGAEVEFVVTAQDVIHGMKIAGTTVNAMLIPGQVTRVTHTFETPADLELLCQEYCGLGHSQMFAKVVVE